MSIKDNLLKIKPFFNKNTLSVIILILVAISSFGLGKISANREKRTPIILGAFETQKTSQISNITPVPTSKKAVETMTDTVVASKNGKSYYFASCAGAKRILDENKITFSSKIEAEKAGYKPAQNCKGLTQ